MIISSILYRVYSVKSRLLRNLVLRVLCRIERGECFSKTLRKIFRDYYGIEIGMYTHGGCFKPNNFGRFTTIGRYTSVARSAKAFNRNHPMDWKSTHALFFNPELNYCDRDFIDYAPLKIGNDVWIGEYALILPNVCHHA